MKIITIDFDDDARLVNARSIGAGKYFQMIVDATPIRHASGYNKAIIAAQPQRL
jgi:hypothetical protein